MCVEVTKSGSRSYVQLTSRPTATRRPRLRTIATLGRLDQIGGASLKSVQDRIGRILGLPPAREIIERYKALPDINRDLKMLKSNIEIGPVYHRFPDRIREHVLIGCIAVVLAHVMRARLRHTSVPQVQSPERALWVLGRIRIHQVRLAGGVPLAGTSAMDSRQTALLATLLIGKPTSHVADANL